MLTFLSNVLLDWTTLQGGLVRQPYICEGDPRQEVFVLCYRLWRAHQFFFLQGWTIYSLPVRFQTSALRKREDYHGRGPSNSKGDEGTIYGKD